MKEKIKLILISVLIGFIAFPAISFGGTFVVSLIQGKTSKEAIQILAQQLDSLIGKVGIIENKQSEQEKYIVCDHYNNLKQSLHWKDSVEAKYEWFKTATILDICNQNFGDLECSQRVSRFANENELIKNLRQNYGNITIEEVKETFIKIKQSIEDLYINSQPAFAELENAKKECDKANANN